MKKMIIMILLLALIAPGYAQPSNSYDQGIKDGLKAGWDVISAFISGDQRACREKVSAWNNMAQTYLGPEYVLDNYGSSESYSALPPAVVTQSYDYDRGLRASAGVAWDLIQALLSGDQKAMGERALAWNKVAQAYLGPEYLLNPVGSPGSSALTLANNSQTGALNYTTSSLQGALSGPDKSSYGPFMDDSWKPSL